MRHLAIIMDGNGRWAKSRNLPVVAGHEKGAQALLRVMEDFSSLPIDVLTFYALSSDNVKNRDKEEIANLLGVIAYFLSHDVSALAKKNHYKLRIVGDLTDFPEPFSAVVSDVNAKFINEEGKTVVFAIGYGGYEEVLSAFNRILKRREFLSDFSPVTREELDGNLLTAGLPDPDAVLRYGGYQRMSNFLPLQTIYSELFFVDTLWPDYNRGDIQRVLDDFAKIKRNFGGRNG